MYHLNERRFENQFQLVIQFALWWNILEQKPLGYQTFSGHHTSYILYIRQSLWKLYLHKVASESKRSSEEDCVMLHDLLHVPFFDGTLDTWKTEPVDIELQPGDKIYHAKTHPVKGTWTHIKEVIGGSFLTRVTWIMKWIILGTPHLYPNNNNGADRFLSDIRKLIR